MEIYLQACHNVSDVSFTNFSSLNSIKEVFLCGLFFLLGQLDKMLGLTYNEDNKRREKMPNNLSASLEDYLELICNLLQTSQSVKAVEIARKLNISRASVSEALARLAEKKLIVYEGHKGITITPEGLEKAKEVIDKHNTLTALFEDVFGFNRETSEENACKIEHIINGEVFDRIKKFLTYCRENQDFISNFKKGNINKGNE